VLDIASLVDDRGIDYEKHGQDPISWACFRSGFFFALRSRQPMRFREFLRYSGRQVVRRVTTQIDPFHRKEEFERITMLPLVENVPHPRPLAPALLRKGGLPQPAAV